VPESLLLPPDQPQSSRGGPASVATASVPSGAVVVGIDDGPLPWGLLEHALRVALRRGSAITVVHVHLSETPRTPSHDDAAVHAEAYLTSAAPISVTRRCVTGDRARALVAAAEPGALLALGERHRRLGTVAGTTLDAVIEAAPCPVLVVDESAPPPGPEGGVVVGVDGSADASTVLHRALAEAAELATRVRAISTWTAPEKGPDEDVADLVGTAGKAFPQVPVTVERFEDRAGRALLGAGTGAALLVLGHRHPAAQGLRGRGSTARTVLAALPCPVLVLGPGVLDTDPSGTERP
jgi:nucleotide-binding universal stress UspA family protein